MNGNISTQGNRGADKGNRGHPPIAVQIGAVEIQFRLAKGIQAQYLHFLLRQVTTREDSQQGRLSASVGTNQQASGTGLERQIQVLQHIVLVELVQGAGAAVTECQIIDIDRIRTVIFDVWQRLGNDSLLLQCHC